MGPLWRTASGALRLRGLPRARRFIRKKKKKRKKKREKERNKI